MTDSKVQYEVVDQGELYIVGIHAETNNADEMNGKGKIPGLWGRFFAEGIGEKIPNRMFPAGIAVMYTDIATDENGPYRIVIGALVNSTDRVPEGMVAAKAPAGSYAKVTSPRGPLARVTMEAWQAIWSDMDLKARRAYSGDLELYDERALDPEDGQLDILVSLK